MDSVNLLTEPQKAVLLLAKGLSAKNSALRGDQNYSKLLAQWRADPDFRKLVQELAPMMDLRVVDVLDHAIVLAPTSPGTIFATTLTEFRTGLGEMTRGAIALIHIAIAATFFPTASVLTDAEEGRDGVSATPTRIAAILRAHCERLEAEASKDTDLVEAGLVEAWRELARLPDTRPDGSQRAALTSLAGMVKLVLNRLSDYAMVQNLEGDAGDRYVATPRYRLQVRELASNEIYERCAAMLPNFLGDGEG